MTACFIFELRSKVEPETVQQQLSKIWTRSAYGWRVDIFLHEKNRTLVCELLYYFSEDLECRERIEEILDYLFQITVDEHIYYYRFQEAMDWYWKSKQKITIDMLFDEYNPTLGGNCLRYEIFRS